MKIKLSILVMLMAVFQFPQSAVPAEEGEDWATVLGADEEEASADTGVVGMSAEEMENYIQHEQVQQTADEEVPDVFIRTRRRFVLRQLRFDTDWDCDPTAVPAMADQFGRLTGVQTQALVPPKPLTFDSPEIFDYPFIFMTAHYAFKFSDAESEGFRKYIERGGFIYADDCLYGQTFGPAFHGEVERIFPECQFKGVEPKDPVDGLVLKQKYKFGHVQESGIPTNFLNANPWEGIWFNGRLSVLYSPQDIGCYWEISSPPTPSNPLGAGMHGKDIREPGAREIAYKLGVNIILFSMLH